MSIARRVMWTAAALAAAAPVAAQQSVQLPSRDVALKDRPTDVYSVGTVEGKDWEMFSGIRSVAFDRADNMYLLDGQNLRIVMFDARGKFVRQFGKKGGGPGEFQAPLMMDITADGNIVVSDLGNRAFILFKPDGEYIRNVTFGEDVGMPMGGLVADRQGGVISRSMPRVRPDQAQTDATRFSTIFRLSLASDNSAIEPLFRIPMAPPRVIEAGGSSGERRVASINMDPVFGPRPTFGALPTGLAVHHETEYGIRILDAKGGLTRTLTREYKPRKVTKKDQEEWEARRQRESANGTGPTVVMAIGGSGGGNVSVGRGAAGAAGAAGSALRMTLDNVPFAELMSVVTGIRTDPQGRIWVQRRNADGSNAGPIDLVMPDGRYIGTLPPQPLPNAVSASGLAAWVMTDDLGVERVSVRRLPASWR